MLDQVTLLYQVTPIFLTGGLAGNIAGGILPLLALTNANAFTSNLLAGNENFALDDAFGVFQPAVGGSLIEQVPATYPYANLNVAANAIIRNPINVSMLMATPMRQASSWAVKLAIMTALKATLDAHNNAGGTYTVCTPAYIYTDMILLNLVDVSMLNSPIPQNAWRWDFTKPLVTQADAQGAQSNLMNQISQGVPPTISSAGPSVTDPTTALTSDTSIVNTGVGAGATSPWVSQTPLVPGQNTFNFNPITNTFGDDMIPAAGSAPSFLLGTGS